jgi:hypothetical protein
VRVTDADSFDPPPGDGAEHDEVLADLLDGDATTAWTTERYNERTFGTKPGVGVVLKLEGATELRTLTVDSSTSGWKASIYVADGPKSTLAAWGSAVSTMNGPGTVSLKAREGAAVLIWITDLGPTNVVRLGGAHLTR